MASYAEQLRFAEANAPLSGTQKRMDCPFCRGHNSLSITKENGSLKWFCFRASCHTRGTESVTRTGADITSILRPQEHEYQFHIPQHFTRVTGNENAVRYLERNHSLSCVLDSTARCLYDPRLDRVVFLVQHHGEVVDAVGRAMDHTVRPKWLRYGSSGYPFVAAPAAATTGVIVEDAASACAVTQAGLAGIAILGTNLLTSHLEELQRFNNVIIALDPDASHKALELHRQASYYTKAVVRFIDSDLKYYDKEGINAQLRIG